MSIDEQHVALPKLYGAPAYARPPITVAVTPRPFDPDELPLEALRTDEDLEGAATIPAQAYGSTGVAMDQQGPDDRGRGGLIPRSFSIRGLAGRFLGGD